MAGKSYIKVGAYDWDRIKKMYIKTGGQTWSAIRKAYVKTDSGLWKKVFDTASNRPFIAGNDIPKIRLNTFRTGSTYNPAGTLDDPVDPLVEAPPVQQMGPTWTSPTYGWPYESLGRHLWGYDGTWTSGNGTSMTFTYTWLYNLTGNSNDNTAELNATSTTGRTDMLTNLSSHLGQSDGDYFDKNFLTFRVTATNSAGNASAESAPVYIVREVPTGSITMVSPTLAFTNSSMSATFTYSNNWYNKTDISNSYIEWFAVSNLGDALTNTNRVQIETLSSIAVSGTTSKSGTTSHVPTLANKYYYVKMTLNNSGTQNAVIAITGFTPKSSVTSQSNKTVVTGAVLDPQPFNTISYVKNFPSSGSGGVVRSTSLSWNASTNATRYEIEYEGSYNNSTWTTLQTFGQSAYTSSTSQSVSWGSPIPAGGFDYYTYMRARVRASNTTSTVQVIGDNGSYIYATGVAPGQPSFGTITKTDTTASIPVTVGSAGSNYLYSPPFEYQYRASSGSYSGTWTSSSSPIPLTGLTPNTTYYIKIRTRNYDEIVSAENETTFQTNASLVGATSTFISSMSRLSDSTVQAVISSSGAGGPYYQLYWNSGTFSSIPTTSYYDAASTSSTVTEIMSPPSGTSYYFLIRSSDQNLGNTTASGSQNSGSYSSYGPTSSPATYTFASPSGGSVSVNGSSTVGSTLTASLSSPSASPAADSVSIVWRVNDGGTGGNSYTAGSVLQNGGTTFVIPQYLYGSVSSVGYLIRAEVTWNNGVGSQTANSTSTAVTAAGVAPSGGSVTLSPSGTQMAGTTITANVSAMSGTATISYTTTLRKKTGSAPTSSTDGTEVASGTGTGNVASHTITTTEASGSPDQFRAFTTGSNSFGSTTVISNTVVSTPYVAPVVTPSGGTATVTPSSGTAGSTTYTASTSGWSGSPTSYSYSWQYFSQSSFSYVQYSTGSTFSPPSNINSSYPNYGWLLSVGASNTAGTAYATTTFTVNSPAVAAPSTPTGLSVSGSGAVTWNASSGSDSYDLLIYTATNSSGSGQLGPYSANTSSTSFQLTSSQGYSSPNNWARVQVRGRNNSGQVSTYGAWYPSSTTYV